MLWRNKISSFVMFHIFAATFLARFEVFANDTKNSPTPFPVKMDPNFFRVPAKLVGDQFVIKLDLRQGIGAYVITAWLDPKARNSTLDSHQMKEMGWRGIVQDWSEVSSSGNMLPIWRFKEGSNETAYLPNFAKSCCVARIGQDVLSDYQVKAVELKDPTDLGMMIVDSVYVEFKKVDRKNNEKSSFEVIRPKLDWAPAKKPLFSYIFVPPARKVMLTSNYQTIPKNSEWLSVNGRLTATLDQPVLQAYLMGRKTKSLKLEFKNKKNEVTPLEHVFQ